MNKICEQDLWAWVVNKGCEHELWTKLSTRVEFWTWVMKSCEKSFEQKLCTKFVNMSCEEELWIQFVKINLEQETCYEQKLRTKVVTDHILFSCGQ